MTICNRTAKEKIRGKKKEKIMKRVNLKTLSFKDKDKIKGKINSTMIDFLV